MNTLRTIETTGARLVEDVKRLFCLTCEGSGAVMESSWDSDSGRYVPDGFTPCPDCHGFGF